jgi:phage protein D
MLDILRARNRLLAPAYKMTVNDSPASNVIIDRLVSISMTSNGGDSSDQLSLTLDAKSNRFFQEIKLPEANGKTKITLWLGYEFNLIKVGIFYVDTVSVSGSTSGQTMTISAIPKIMANQVTQHWADTTIGKLVDVIAKRHELVAKVDASLKDTKIASRMQTNESDINFLTHYAQELNVITKPVAEHLIFLKKGQGTSASGTPLTPITLRAEDITQWDLKKGQRQQPYSCVTTHYYNYHDACCEYITEGEAGESLVIDTQFNTEEEAKLVAKSKFEAFSVSDDELSLTVIGDPKLTAEAKVVLTKAHPYINGEWYVKSASHSYSASGFQTSLTAYRMKD